MENQGVGLSTLKKFKDLEKRFSRQFAYGFRRVVVAIASFFKKIHRTGRQKLTLMLVPHTESRILNIQISFYGIAFFFFLVISISSVFIFVSSNYSNVASQLATKTATLSGTQTDLDAIRDSAARLVKSVQKFQVSVDSTLANIGGQSSSSAASSRGGDLAAFFNETFAGTGRIHEVTDLDRISEYLEKSADSFKDIGAVLASQGVIMTKIPSIWPVQGDLGHISMHYGQNPNPIYGSWYIHKGIDISTYRQGDPVLATADGKVSAVGFAVDFGYFIVIEHDHGFMTRYAHLKAQNVQKGQMVSQGQVIGWIGNTGITTGPHLHYEIHLGTDTIDPLPFMHKKNKSLTN